VLGLVLLWLLLLVVPLMMPLLVVPFPCLPALVAVVVISQSVLEMLRCRLAVLCGWKVVSLAHLVKLAVPLMWRLLILLSLVRLLSGLVSLLPVILVT
jgi:hypothetical protein